MEKISTAVISVTDKSGIVEFARSLDQLGIEILFREYGTDNERRRGKGLGYIRVYRFP